MRLLSRQAHTAVYVLLACGLSACSGASSSSDAGDADYDHDAGSGDGAQCEDHCATAHGVTVGCEKRFLYGVNFAWHYFSADFGGLKAWNMEGVSTNVEAITADLEEMETHGVDVVRWWLFPTFSGDGVTFDSDDAPIGLGSRTLPDIEAALQMAADLDMHLMLTLFSFDNFLPTADEHGVRVRNIKPILFSPEKRTALLEEVVRPIARAVQASPHRDRMIAWDVINEPEWAIYDSDPYGDPPFDPQTNLDSIRFSEMEDFIADVIAVLRSESKALVTVGNTALIWPKAWSHVDLDFYSFHLYDWINVFRPYSLSPVDVGVTDKPVVMQEFPLIGLRDVPYSTLLNSFSTNGYGGALPWAFTDGPWDDARGAISAFAAAHPCVTHY